MSKHSEAFKRSVVEFYQKGERGTREVGRHFGVDHATVRKWAAIYAAHGPLGQAKKSSHYDTASVLQRMWKDGLSMVVSGAVQRGNGSCLPYGRHDMGFRRTRSTRGSCFFSPGWNDVAWRWINYDRYPYDWSAVMLVHRWKKPLVLGDRRIRIVVGSPEEAMNWLIHEPNQTSDKWRRAWQACRAAIDGRMAAEDAKSAVQLAVER